MVIQQYVTDFINKISVLAVAEAKKRKAEGKAWSLPSVCIAQSALETGWGRSDLMVKANAFFGIKAGKSWKGKVYSSKTQECYDGVSYTTITALFRAYDSLEESVKDYYDLICNNKRYAGAVGETDARACITAIKEGGYATSPDYIANVMSIVEKYDLTKYDNLEEAKELKSEAEIVKEVINGKWGNGAERKAKLTEAGYNADVIQAKVNEALGGKKTETKVEAPKKEEPVKPTKPAKTLDDVAREVINGKWGNGSARREALEKAGYNYSEVQAKVNEILNGKTSSNKSEPADTTYTIKSGDTLSKIARNFYGVSNSANIQKIANANNISNPNIIRAGATIKIPR